MPWGRMGLENTSAHFLSLDITWGLMFYIFPPPAVHAGREFVPVPAEIWGWGSARTSMDVVRRDVCNCLESNSGTPVCNESRTDWGIPDEVNLMTPLHLPIGHPKLHCVTGSIVLCRTAWTWRWVARYARHAATRGVRVTHAQCHVRDHTACCGE